MFQQFENCNSQKSYLYTHTLRTYLKHLHRPSIPRTSLIMNITINKHIFSSTELFIQSTKSRTPWKWRYFESFQKPLTPYKIVFVFPLSSIPDTFMPPKMVHLKSNDYWAFLVSSLVLDFIFYSQFLWYIYIYFLF